jgi:hypothetical protein
MLCLFHCSRMFWQLNKFVHSGHQCHYHDQLWALVPWFSLIQGQQRLSFDLGGDSGPSESLFTLNLSLFTQTPVAIYRFECRMSNTKISPQLATLDGQVIASNALYREIFWCLQHEALHRWTHRVPYTLQGFDLISPRAARVEVAPVHGGLSRGTQIWVC